MVLDVAAVVGPDGWITWRALTARVDRKTVAAQVVDSAGRLTSGSGPGVYRSSALAQDWRIRVDGRVSSRSGVASHRTALALWGLLPPGGPIHVTVEPGRSNRGSRASGSAPAAGPPWTSPEVGGLHVTQRGPAGPGGHLGPSAGDAAVRPCERAAITAVRRPPGAARGARSLPARRGVPHSPPRVAVRPSWSACWPTSERAGDLGPASSAQGVGMPRFTQQHRSRNRARHSSWTPPMRRCSRCRRWTARRGTVPPDQDERESAVAEAAQVRVARRCRTPPARRR